MGIGIVTVIVACLAFFALFDFPETAGFLTEEERAFVIYRLKYQGQDQDSGRALVAQAEEFKWKYVKDAFLDWHIWVNIFVYWGVSLARGLLIAPLTLASLTRCRSSAPSTASRSSYPPLSASSATRAARRSS